MSKFNQTAQNNTETVNLAGGQAFSLDDETALYVTAVTSLGGGAGDKYYRTANEEYSLLLKLIDKVAKKDPAFIFQLAAYARKEMYLRSVPTILFIEGIRAMHKHKRANDPYPVDVKQFAYDVFGRPDEITEGMAYWKFITEDSNKLPMPLRKSLALALNKFGEYSLVKYAQDNKEVKFRDVLRRVHPTPKNEAQSALFNYLLRDELDGKLMPLTAAREKLLKCDEFNAHAKHLIAESNATWETVISKFGSSQATWTHVLPNMGYMATLRNLNNFLKHDVPLSGVIEMLTNPAEVSKSKQLPFRFFSALKAIGQSTETPRRGGYGGYGGTIAFTELDAWSTTNISGDGKEALAIALNTALQLSVANVPKFEGRTLIAADVSGSMDTSLNDKSSVTLKEIACLMAALAQHMSEDGIASAFGDTFMTVKPTPNNILATARNVAALERTVGWSTNAWTVLDYLIKNKIVCNRVMYFTDTQCYNSYGSAKNTLNNLWKQYKGWLYTQGVNGYLYEVNLAGGNTSAYDRNSGVAIIAGWSDRIFEAISTFETDPRSMIKKIKEKYSVQTLVGV